MSKLSIALAAVTLMAVTGYLIMNSQTTNTNSKYEAEFKLFKSLYRKEYYSLEDQGLRFEIFKTNMDLIHNHNANKRTSYTLAMNEFADLTYEEFKNYYLSEIPKNLRVSKDHCVDPQIKGSDADAVDWDAQGKVQKVKNQASCGSCWAFSAVGAMESAIAISKGGEIPDLSEQELVDCSTSYGNGGCGGGLMNFAFNYVLDHNIHHQKEYPYTAQDGACKTDQIGEGSVEINGCVRVTPNVQGLVEGLSVQPVSVAFYVQDDFRFYNSGVYNPASCNGQANHGVLAYGYNSKASVPYFQVKNSWGPNWGLQGKFNIAFGSGKGTCTIAGTGFNYYPLA
jgi:C1A family cysteine protease